MLKRKKTHRGPLAQMKINGIEIEDAAKPLRLHIRDSDTKLGKKHSPEGCAAAISACRETGVIEARVYRTRTYLLRQDAKGKKKWERYNTPAALRGEIIAFDRGGTFQADDYTLGVVQDSEKLGAKRNRPSSPTGNRSGYNSPHILRGVRPLAPRGPSKV
jgi:hypothetical protein